MAKDYAKYGHKKRWDKPHRWELFAVFFLVAVISLTIGWASINKLNATLSSNPQTSPWLAALQHFFSHKKPVKNEEKIQPPVVTKEEIHFDFYNDLPQMQMSVE